MNFIFSALSAAMLLIFTSGDLHASAGNDRVSQLDIERINKMEDPILVLGVSNDASCERFKGGNYVILDKNSAPDSKSKDCPPFLQIDLDNLDDLKFLAEKFPGKFDRIMFDWSVSQFVGWKKEHLGEIVKIVKPGGQMYYPFPFEIAGTVAQKYVTSLPLPDKFDENSFVISPHIVAVPYSLLKRLPQIRERLTKERNEMIMKAFKVHFGMVESKDDGYPDLHRRDGKHIDGYLVATKQDPAVSEGAAGGS